MAKAFAGVRVLDFTRFLAGPFGTWQFALQGADVIKIEPPGGEFARGGGPFMSEDSGRVMGGPFASINRNKRSLALDLRSRKARRPCAG